MIISYSHLMSVPSIPPSFFLSFQTGGMMSKRRMQGVYRHLRISVQHRDTLPLLGKDCLSIIPFHFHAARLEDATPLTRGNAWLIDARMLRLILKGINVLNLPSLPVVLVAPSIACGKDISPLSAVC